MSGPDYTGDINPPAEAGNVPVSTVGGLLNNTLVDAGIVGINESVEPQVLNRAFTQANWLLADWARKRYLVYRISDYSIVSTGVQTYYVGLSMDININPRPDRLEYAFLRFLNSSGTSQSTTTSQSTSSGSGTDLIDTGIPILEIDAGGVAVNTSSPIVTNFNVDIPLEIIESHEDYSRITVKGIGTLPWRIFYDPAWPVGRLVPWPVAQATIYEIHVGFKEVLPRFTSVAQSINFPPEYEAALNWGLARRLRASYQLPADETINNLARNSLNTIRLANQAMGVLRMPAELRNRQRAYDYRGDDNY